MQNKNVVRTSKLGVLYEQSQGLRNFKNVALSVLQSFEFFIICGERLPITVSPVELGLTERFELKDMENILDFLKEQGCVVNYKYEDYKHKFILKDLL